ncbi:MAG: sulfurtransferase TusA family protein [Thermoanaerobacteraceae bacterium]|nr:sulfurtransferase TusA family protein [Thermoanaerobacteraceae bacterium]
MAEKKLNLLGDVCPIPLLKTQKAFVKLNSEDVLIVETDVNQAARNILNWCDSEGYDFEIDEEGEGVWRITIRKA